MSNNTELQKMKSLIENLKTPTLLKDIVKLVQSKNINLSENYIRTTLCLWDSLGLIKNVVISKSRHIINSKFREVYKTLFISAETDGGIEYLENITSESVKDICQSIYGINISRNYICSILSSLHLFGVLEIDASKDGQHITYKIKNVPDSVLAKIDEKYINIRKETQMELPLQSKEETFDPNNLTPEQIGLSIIAGNYAMKVENDRLKENVENMIRVVNDKVKQVEHLKAEVEKLLRDVETLTNEKNNLLNEKREYKNNMKYNESHHLEKSPFATSDFHPQSKQ